MAATLADEGFRYLEINGVFAWVHPAEVPAYVAAGATDTTDMNDEAFEAYVASLGASTA